jgi:predicted dehydrogenase
MSEPIKVGIIGTKFMGRAHSNAFIDVPYFYDLPRQPEMRAACGVDETSLKTFAKRFGWETTETSYQRMVSREDIDMVDICTSNASHFPMAMAAAKAGKHIICEKPLAMNASEARRMLDAANEAGVRHMVAFNYRRVPAIVLAKQLIDEGKIGKIYHFNAVYLQDWMVDPNGPFAWRSDASQAGSGAHGDLNAHIIDLARYLNSEVSAVSAVMETFVKERPLPDGKGKATVTVDDAAFLLARFQNGGIGSFQATRFAPGRKNFLRLEIFGSKGSINFNLERLNELEFHSLEDDGKAQGFRTIMVTESMHPYLDRWWPVGHIIGWEHSFIHEIGDFLLAVAKNEPVYPDFYDGLRCQQVLDAAVKSSVEQRWIEVPEA